jgi:vacuolar-type H+-ATPase subunit I/STV1
MKIDINKTSLLEEIQRPGAWFKKVTGKNGNKKPVKNQNRLALATTLKSGFNSLLSTKKLRKSAEANVNRLQTQHDIRKNSSYDPIYSNDKKHETYNIENQKRLDSSLNNIQLKIDKHKNTIEKYRNIEDTKRKLLKTQQYSNSIDVSAKKYAETQGKKIPEYIDPNTRITNDRIKSFDSMPKEQRQNILEKNKNGGFNPMVGKLNSPEVQREQIKAGIYTKREIDNFNKGSNNGLGDHKPKSSEIINNEVNTDRNRLGQSTNQHNLHGNINLTGGQGAFILQNANDRAAASRHTA